MSHSRERYAPYAIFFSTFVSNAGSYLVIPILSVYLASAGGLSAAVIGTIFALMSVSQTGGSLLAGWAAGRVGTQPVLLTALAIRIVAFPLLLLPGVPIVMAAACAAIWFGSGAYVPTAKAALAATCSEQSRPRFLALRSTVANAGAALGPLIGLVITQYASRQALFVGASAAFAVSVLVSVLAAVPRDVLPTQSPGYIATLQSLLRLPGAGRVLLLALAVYSSIPLFELVVPMYGAQSVGTVAPQVAFFCNAMVVILAQAPLANTVARMTDSQCVVLGFGLIAASCLMMLHAGGNLWLFSAGAIVYSLGEVLLILRIDITTANIGRLQWAAAFGFVAAAGPLGGVIGSQTYGALFGVLDTAAFWSAALCIALTFIAGYLLWERLTVKADVSSASV